MISSCVYMYMFLVDNALWIHVEGERKGRDDEGPEKKGREKENEKEEQPHTHR